MICLIHCRTTYYLYQQEHFELKRAFKSKDLEALLVFRRGGWTILFTELHFRNIQCTRDMGKMLPVEMQIAERARKYRSEALTNLHEFINEPLPFATDNRCFFYCGTSLL